MQMETRDRNGRPKRYVPKYDDATKAKILRFLAAMMLEAEKSLIRTRGMAGNDYHVPVFFNKIKYHENQVSTIRWLISRASDRQGHLMDVSDETIAEVLGRCDRTLVKQSEPE